MLIWNSVLGASSYLLQRGIDCSFLSGTENLYEGQETSFVDRLGSNTYKVSLSPVRTWQPTFCYRVKAQGVPGTVADGPWSETIEL